MSNDVRIIVYGELERTQMQLSLVVLRMLSQKTSVRLGESNV